MLHNDKGVKSLRIPNTNLHDSQSKALKYLTQKIIKLRGKI